MGRVLLITTFFLGLRRAVCDLPYIPYFVVVFFFQVGITVIVNTIGTDD